VKKGLLLLNILGIAACSVALSSCESKSKRYGRLMSLTTNFKDRYDYVTVDELLDKLPDKYKNVGAIKEEYLSMRRFIVDLSNANLSDSEGESARASFKRLSLLKDLNTFWDISSFLNNPVIYDSVVYGKSWSSTYDNFYWRDGTTQGQQLFSTSLSNKKEEDKDYYFYTRYSQNDIVFGYQNKDDSNDKFDAYAIKFVGYENNQLYISVACYNENYTYRLSE